MASERPRPPAVELRDVAVRVGNRTLVSGVSFSVAAGETLAMLGRSGSGKTTTLKLLNRLNDPSEGEVLVEGRSTKEWDPIRLRRRIGYVIQETGLFPHYDVEANVALVPRLEGWSEERIRPRVAELLEMVGLPPSRFGRRYPKELSGGQRQRVGVARALAADPAIVLMDEPFGALDPITRTELQREFSDLVRRLGKTICIVTHDIGEAFALASKIALFEDGRLVLFGEPDAFARSENPEARAFMATLDVHAAAMARGQRAP